MVLVIEGPKVVTVEQRQGVALISADLHGNHEDFAALRDLFLAAEARGERPIWVSVGDWVHGPSPAGRRDILGNDGVPLFDYQDRTPEILDELFALMDRFPGRVLSLCGNHEHSHIGGPRTSKFHPDEAAALEARLSPVKVAELKRRFASWPILVLLPGCGVVVAHGAPPAASPADFEAARFAAGSDLLASALTRYGFAPGEDLELLHRLGEGYGVLVHGHDRDEEGFARVGAASVLLCSSFGARRDRKAYLWLDLGVRYSSPDALRDGVELRRLFPPVAS